MASVEDQSIPAEYQDLYAAALNSPTWQTTQTKVRKRYPWRMPHMQGPRYLRSGVARGSGVSAAQVEQRKMFALCVQCYNIQPYSGGATPPAEGPRNRGYWYTSAVPSGLWYYDYFLQTTITPYLAGQAVAWCKTPCAADWYVDSTKPNNSYSTVEWLHAKQYPAQTREEAYFTKQYAAQKFLSILFGSLIPPATATIEFWGTNLPDPLNQWTWNTKPLGGEILERWNLTQYGNIWHSVDAKGYNTIRIKGMTGWWLDIPMYSMENRTAAYRPYWT